VTWTRSVIHPNGTCLWLNHGDQSSLIGRPSFFNVYLVEVVGILPSVSPLFIQED
jgi:hypothetical protein